MMKQRLKLLDTEAIALFYGVAPGTIRRWAHLGRWTPYGSRRNRQWNLIEIEAWRRGEEEARHERERGSCA